MRLQLICTFMILIMVTSLLLATEDKPTLEGVEGKRAFDELAKYYKGVSEKPAYEQALKDLSADNTAKSASAGKYLLALLMQTLSDEVNKRSEWEYLPYWGGEWSNKARELRKEIAEKFGEKASGEEAFSGALWLIESDIIAQNQSAGMKALRRVTSDNANYVLKRVLSEPHQNGEVLKGAIEEVVHRNLKETLPQLLILCNHYRKAVREAAAAGSKKLGATEIPEFTPEKAFTPWLDKQMKNISALILTDIPKKAEWGHFEITFPPYMKGGKPQIIEFGGWFLSEKEGKYKVLNWFGEEKSFDKKQTKFTARTFQEEAMSLLELRDKIKKAYENKDENAWKEDRLEEQLSQHGGASGQFEPSFVSAPEALMSAWSYVRGYKKEAATILFPRIDEMQNNRELTLVTRDLLGHLYHQEMLAVFTYERDYARTIKIARHLSKPIFNDYNYQPRAKELTEQLQERLSEDFKTLTLPTPEQWEKLVTKMTREKQIEYLAKRLRLLNCFQMGQPGGVRYEDPQFIEPGFKVYKADEDKKAFAINPYIKLKEMKLKIAELPVLVPFLADENFMLAFSYWRDFHPDRTLHRVNWAVANIINETAMHELIDVSHYSSLDANGKKEIIEKAMKWCIDNASATKKQIILNLLNSTGEWQSFYHAALEATKEKILEAIPLMIKRMSDFKNQQDKIVALCHEMNSPEIVSNARIWIKHSEEGVRFWAALILLRHGNAEKLEGLSELKLILDNDDGTYWYPRAFDDLLSIKKEPVLKLACDILGKKDLRLSDWSLETMLHKLFLAGQKECIDFILEKFESDKKTSMVYGEWEGNLIKQNLEERDTIAVLIAKWRMDNYNYPATAPEEKRAQERDKLKKWIKEQYDLIKAGRKPNMKTIPESFQYSEWQIDAP